MRIPYEMDSGKMFGFLLHPRFGNGIGWKNLGILGFGAIGGKTAEIGKAFGMKVWLTLAPSPRIPKRFVPLA